MNQPSRKYHYFVWYGIGSPSGQGGEGNIEIIRDHPITAYAHTVDISGMLTQSLLAQDLLYPGQRVIVRSWELLWVDTISE